jgi:hypothetical protein
MPRISSTPMLTQGDASSCGSCSCQEELPKRSASSSWLSKMSLGRYPKPSNSSSTLESLLTTDHEETLSTRSTDIPTAARLPGGCLKIPTHAMSLVESCCIPQTIGLVDDPRSVSFGAMEVLIFDLQLGDNPSVSVGPPIAMGKQLHARMTLTVESYEATRPTRRHKQELVVPKFLREDWLRDEGFSRGECKEREGEVLAIKKSRKASSAGCASPFALRLFGRKSGSTRRPKQRTSVMRNI